MNNPGFDYRIALIENKFRTGYLLKADNFYSHFVSTPYGFDMQIQKSNFQHILENADISCRAITQPMAIFLGRADDLWYQQKVPRLLIQFSEEHLNSSSYNDSSKRIHINKVNHIYNSSHGKVVFLGNLTTWYYDHGELNSYRTLPMVYVVSTKNIILTTLVNFYLDLGEYDKTNKQLVDSYNTDYSYRYFTIGDDYLVLTGDCNSQIHLKPGKDYHLIDNTPIYCEKHVSI